MIIEVMMIDHHLNERKSQRKVGKRRITKRKRVVVEAATNGIENILVTVAVVAAGSLRRMQMLIEEEIEKINEVMTTTTRN
jgi:prolyl-tRNA editing enzyme YbaK/EbsC (Cys-tRNA(Pro) deacylase)